MTTVRVDGCVMNLSTYILFFVYSWLQTKKYADVIIPRGVENSGEYVCVYLWWLVGCGCVS